MATVGIIGLTLCRYVLCLFVGLFHVCSLFINKHLLSETEDISHLFVVFDFGSLNLCWWTLLVRWCWWF